MLYALKEAYLGLLNFNGRMAIGAFWIYAGVNFALSFIAYSIAFAGFFQQFATIAAKVAQSHPEDVTVRQGPGSIEISVAGNHPGLMPDITGLLGVSALLGFIFFALIAAAATRRLHDTGRSGVWILLPIPFLAFSFLRMPEIFAHFRGDGRDFPLGQFALLFASNLAYLLCLLVVAVLLGLPGNEGENRFGPPPVQNKP